MKMKMIVVVEDKKEEIIQAISAIKKALGAKTEVEGLGIGIDDVFGSSSFKMGFEMVEGDMTPYTIVYGCDLKGAEQAIRFARDKVEKSFASSVYILTDFMFPLNKGGQEQANGVSIILDVAEAGIPGVVCSDTDHHEVEFLPKLAKVLRKTYPEFKINLILDKKDWGKAVDLLLT